MSHYLSEQQIIKATGTTRAGLRKLLRIGIITAEPRTSNPIEYHQDTIEILKSMQNSEGDNVF